jgi:tryptophan-rich hypothetical protein
MSKPSSLGLEIEPRLKREVEAVLAPPGLPPSATVHLNPAKLRLSKWSAVYPRDREKHFLVTRVINPEAPVHQIETVEIEAVLTRRRYLIPWRELENDAQWRPGWA